MPVKNLFDFYNSIVKPIYVEIEARGNTLPIELLFETHSALDHFSRIYTNSDNEDKCVEKAISHLKRGALDAFKLKLKYFYKELAKFDKIRVDLTLIDNGEFYKNYSQLLANIKGTAKKARLEEKKIANLDNIEDVLRAFNDWLQVSTYIDQMEETYLHSDKIPWAKIKTYKIWCIQTIVAFIIGVLTGVFGNFLWSTICPKHTTIQTMQIIQPQK
jgi:uncharacterized protein YeeX (DUF496 family)